MKIKKYIILLTIFIMTLSLAYAQNCETAKKILNSKKIPINSFEFLKYVQEGDDEIVKLFISAGMNVNCKDKNGNTPLIIASEKGLNSLVRILLENKADVNAKDIGEWTPLIYAAYNGNIEIVNMLLSYGAEVNAREAYSSTALHKACFKGHYIVVKRLIAANAIMGLKTDDGTTPLMYAAISKHKNIVELLIKNGADVNDRDVCDYCSGETALMLVARIGVNGLLKLSHFGS